MMYNQCYFTIKKHSRHTVNKKSIDLLKFIANTVYLRYLSITEIYCYIQITFFEHLSHKESDLCCQVREVQEQEWFRLSRCGRLLHNLRVLRVPGSYATACLSDAGSASVPAPRARGTAALLSVPALRRSQQRH